MPNSKPLARWVFLLACGSLSAAARAQQAQGFAVERLYLSPAGAGWVVMDDLDLQGGLGGAVALTTGYAHDPLAPSGADGVRLGVVSEQAFAALAFAVTYDRFRLSLNLASPLAIVGQSGTIGTVHYSAPNVSLGNDPDTISDPRLGFDARLVGAPGGLWRLGVSAQLWIPSGNRADDDTDGTVRAMFRLLLAGDVSRFLYAAQLGVHVRPLDDASSPASASGSPAGSELLFGAGGGPRFALAHGWDAIVGPEIFGETAFRTFFAGSTTDVEALLTARIEGTGAGLQPRFKLGVGAGLDPGFGAPEWRLVLSAEMFSHPAAR